MENTILGGLFKPEIMLGCSIAKLLLDSQSVTVLVDAFSKFCTSLSNIACMFDNGVPDKTDI